MKKPEAIAISILSATALLLFLLHNALPETDDVLLNEISLVSEMNSLAFIEAKQIGYKSLEDGKNVTFERRRKAMVEIEKAMKIADWIAMCFDKIESGEADPDTVRQRLSDLRKQLTYVSPMDSTDYGAIIDQVLAEWNPDFHGTLLGKLQAENARSEFYAILNKYWTELSYEFGAMSIKFDMGIPGRMPTWKTGLIAFNPPVSLEMGERHRIQIRISKDFRQSILETMPAAEAAQVDSLLVGDVMIVRLEGDDFDVKSYDEEQQGVLDEGYTQWEFEITPKSSGTHTLFVKAGIVYHVRGIGPTKKFFPVYEREITIHVNAWKVVASFLTERWEFLVSTFLVPGLAWAYSRSKRRKASPKKFS